MTQISLGISPVWSESSLSAWRKLGSLPTHRVHSKDSDKAGRMPSLIWVFAERTCHFVGFVVRWLNYILVCFRVVEWMVKDNIKFNPGCYQENFLSVHVISNETAHEKKDLVVYQVRDLQMRMRSPYWSYRHEYFAWNFLNVPTTIYAKSKGSGETAHMRRLAWAFAGRLYHTHAFRMCCRSSSFL